MILLHKTSHTLCSVYIKANKTSSVVWRQDTLYPWVSKTDLCNSMLRYIVMGGKHIDHVITLVATATVERIKSC